MGRVMGIVRTVVNTPRLLFAAVVGDFLLCSGLFWAIEGTGPVASMWWAIVTGTTTGYGDYSPVTTAGRGVAVVFMLSMLLLVLCVGAHFTRAVLFDPDAFTDAEQREMLALLRENNVLLKAQAEQGLGRGRVEQLLAENAAHIHATHADASALTPGHTAERSDGRRHGHL